MLLRRLGKLLLGKATSFQVIAAAMLGAATGFMPGPQAAGMVVALTVVLLILNANLFVAAVIGVAAKLISLPLLPASYFVGRTLLDGPAEPLFRLLINAPVLALLGLEYYAVTGGVVVGALVGLGAAWPILRGLRIIRVRLAGVQQDSERYQRLVKRWWVRLLLFLFVGVRPSRIRYGDLVERRVGLPVRPLGVAAALAVLGGAAALLHFASGPIVAAALHRGLERVNGATVDMGRVELDLAANRLTIANLAMADPNALETDLLRAQLVEADIGGLELLRNRLVLDRVVLSEARNGAARETPGELIGRAPKPPEHVRIPGAEELEAYFETAQRWKQRLAQVRRWLERLTGAGGDRETISERVARRVRQLGYARARADHLVEGVPLLLVRELVAEKMQSTRLPEGETVDLHGRNISTHPSRQKDPPHIEVRSSAQTIFVEAHVAGVLGGGEPNRLTFSSMGLPVSMVAGQWKGKAPIRGGSLDVEGRITWSAGTLGAIDFPLQVVLHRTTIELPGVEPRQIQQLSVPLRLIGPLDAPQVDLDRDALATALRDAGAAELVSEIQERLDSEVRDVTDSLKEKAGGLLDGMLKDGPGRER